MEQIEQNGIERDPSKEEKLGVEEALHLAGSWGTWQKKMFIFISAAQIFTAMHAVAAVFLSATPKYRCVAPIHPVLNNLMSHDSIYLTELIKKDECSLYKYNSTELDIILSEMELLNSTEEFGAKTPHFGAKISDFESFNATVVTSLQKLFTNETVDCSHHEFETDVFQSTIVTEWDLVCTKRWLRSTVQATFMIGILVGSLVFGQIADRYGRRRTVILNLMSVIISGIATAFVQTYLAVLLLRFVVAVSCAGVMITNFVLLMEIIKPEARSICGMCYGFPFGLGIILMSGFAFFIRDWRHLQLAISVAPSVLLIYFWFLPESPRWLASKGRTYEALAVYQRIAKANGKMLPQDSEIIQMLNKDYEGESQKAKEKNFISEQLTLIRTPVMRRRAFLSFYLWCISAMIYYGLIFFGSNIEIDLFVMLAVSGLVELPSFIIVGLILNRIGRRLISAALFFICAAFLMILMTIKETNVYVLLGVVSLGKFFDTAVFQLCYLYTSELFPTNVRNAAVGTSSMFARIGSSMSPYLLDFLGDIHFAAPSTVFGIFSFIAGVFSLFLPETLNKPLPQTVEEVESSKR